MADLLVKLWRFIQGPLQWYLLWLMNDKFMVAVSGVILDDQGQVLLLKHRYWPEGSWGLPGGYIHRGETLEAALAREVKEETGYLINVVSSLKIVSGYKLRLELCYMARLAGGQLKIDKVEIIEAKFFPRDDLPDGLLQSHREIIALVASQRDRF